MKSRVFILSLSLIIVLCSSFSVFGASTVINFSMTEPATSETQGYAVFHMSDNSNRIFMWSINPKASEAAKDTVCTSSMNIVVNEGSVIFTALTNGGVSANWSLIQATTSGNVYISASGNLTSSASYTWDIEPTVEEFCAYGNLGIIDNNIGSSSTWLRVNWGTDSDMTSSFESMLSVLNSINGNITDCETKLNSIDTSANNIESDVDTIRVNLSAIKTSLTNIEGDVDSILSTLKTVNSRLSTMIDNQAVIIDELQLIREAVTYSLQDIQNAPYADNRPFYEFKGSEERLLNDDGLTDIAELELEFGNSFDVVWDLISEAWQSNAKVFTVVIMCLTVGVIKLVLNR